MANNTNNGANLGFESAIWRAADAMRSNMDAAEYKHVVLGLIFLKYISDAFEEMHAKLDSDRKKGADPEDPAEYRQQAKESARRDMEIWKNLKGLGYGR